LKLTRTDVGIAYFITSGTVIAGILESHFGRKNDKEDIRKDMSEIKEGIRKDVSEIKENVKSLEGRVDDVVANLAVTSNNSHWTSFSILKALSGDKTAMKESLKVLEDMEGCMRSGGTDC